MRLTFDLLRAFAILFRLAQDMVRFVLLGSRSSAALKAENLFLRKQIALYVERQVKPRRTDRGTRGSLVLLSRLFAWREALTIVKPETFVGWHRKGFQVFWRWKSKPRGRPRIPLDLRKLIEEMGRNNPSWGEERIAAELFLKLGIRVSPRTVQRYLPVQRVTPSDPAHRWMTFVRNHAKAIIACDFFVAATATFRLLYVFVVMEIGTRRIIHLNVTTQLGPGIPDPGLGYRPVKLRGHRLPTDHQVVAKSILGGLHHEYRLQRKAA